jgi:hypothetical protein
VKRRQLIKRIADQAKTASIEWRQEREGSNHTLCRLGNTMIPIPRHSEIDDRLAERILKECEAELGERWWR